MEYNAMVMDNARTLLLIGGLGLGLIGLLGFDLLTKGIGAAGLLLRIVFIVIGLSALYILLVMYGVVPHPAPEGFSIHINAK